MGSFKEIKNKIKISPTADNPNTIGIVTGLRRRPEPKKAIYEVIAHGGGCASEDDISIYTGRTVKENAEYISGLLATPFYEKRNVTRYNETIELVCFSEGDKKPDNNDQTAPSLTQARESLAELPSSETESIPNTYQLRQIEPLI